MAPQPSPGMLHTPASITGHHELASHHQQMNGMHETAEEAANNAAMAAAAAAGFTLSNHIHVNQIPTLSGSPFSPSYNFATISTSTPGPGPASPQNNGGQFDPMFGGLPTNAFSSPAPWHGDDGNTRPVGAHLPHSPSAKSNNGSTGTGPGDEKDPFLSLLEQLAESEHARGPGSELDFFLAGTAQQ